MALLFILKYHMLTDCFQPLGTVFNSPSLDTIAVCDDAWPGFECKSKRRDSSARHLTWIHYFCVLETVSCGGKDEGGRSHV